MKLKIDIKVAVVTAATALVAAGCAGGGSEASPHGAGLTKPALKVMVIGNWDSGAGSYEDLPIVTKNLADALNAKGGINGAPVEVIGCNDKADPNESEKCARKAVDEKVVAFVGGYTPFGDRVLPVLERAKIPWLGLLAGSKIANESPNSFAVISSPLLTLAAAYPAGQNCQRTAVMANAAYGSRIMPNLEAGVKSKTGQGFVTEVLVPDDATDMIPYVTQAAAKNPDCIVLAHVEPDYFQLIPAFKARGMLGKYKFFGINGGGLTPRVLEKFGKDVEGWTAVAYFPLLSEPMWDEYRQINEKANNLGKFKSNLGSGTTEQSYVAFEIFRQVALKVQGPVTGESLLAQANKTCDLDMKGIVKNLNFCQENSVSSLKRVFNTTYSWYVVKDGKFTQPAELKGLDVLPAYIKAGLGK